MAPLRLPTDAGVKAIRVKHILLSIFVIFTALNTSASACEEKSELEKAERSKSCLKKFREIDERLVRSKEALLEASKSATIAPAIKDLASYADQSVGELIECQADLLFTTIEVGSTESKSQLRVIDLAQVLEGMAASDFNVSETVLIAVEITAERYFEIRDVP